MHCKFNCITVNFDRTTYGIYTIQNFIKSINVKYMLLLIGHQVTEWQTPKGSQHTGGWNFLCLISISSPTRFACRGIILDRPQDDQWHDLLIVWLLARKRSGNGIKSILTYIWGIKNKRMSCEFFFTCSYAPMKVTINLSFNKTNSLQDCLKCNTKKLSETWYDGR